MGFKKCVICFVAAFFACQSVEATLTVEDLFATGDGLITRDSDSGLDWLDLTVTANLSFDEITDGSEGWIAAGFRYATDEEVFTLYKAAEIPAIRSPASCSICLPHHPSGSDPANDVPVADLLSLIGTLIQPPDQPGVGISFGITLFTAPGNPATITSSELALSTTPMGGTPAEAKIAISVTPSSHKNPGLGSFLVRQSPPNSVLYSTDDLDSRDTQIFTVDLEAGSETLLGPVHTLADLETLAFDVSTETLFGITAETGELWDINRPTGALGAVCTIDTVRKFREISSSSFHPRTGDLWAYQYNRGLVILDLTDCSLTRSWNHPPAPGLRRKWDGIAWKPDGSVLYASQLTDLIVWDPLLETTTVICSNLPKKTEGLEYAPDGRLLGSSSSKIYEIDPETCTVTEAYDLPDREDIESLTFTQSSSEPSLPSCAETGVEREAIEDAVVEAIGSVSDPWTDPDDFAELMTTVESALGCRLRSGAEATVLPQTQKSAACARPGVNYCGPRTSEANPFLGGVVVPQCLNETCCRHDQCYGENCVASECFFTTQSERCDESFFAVCESSCSLFDVATPSAIFVCTVARCLNGILPSPICTQLREARMLASPQCRRQLAVAQGITQVNIQAGVVQHLVVFCPGGTMARDGRIDEPKGDPRLVVLESVADGSTWRWQVTGREGDGVTPMIPSYSASCKPSP